MQPPGHSVLWVDVPPPLGEQLAMEPYGEIARQPLQGVLQSPGLALAVPVAEAASVVPEVEVAEEADVNASSLRV